MNFAIIAAGGKGTRFGTPVIKQLQVLIGKPMLLWSVEAFLEQKEIDQIVIACPPAGYAKDFSEMISRSQERRVTLIEGGGTRYRSVRNGFESISFESEEDVVLIHDAARPLLSARLIRAVLEASHTHGAAVPVLPVDETLKEVQRDRIMRTVSREDLCFSQTPQGFRCGVLRRAYETVSEEEEKGITDEALIVERAGFPVHTVSGERRNIKITRPEDLELAEFYLSLNRE